MPLGATRILNTATANGDGTVFDYAGGIATVVVQGTFDGATAKLQHSLDGGTTYVDCGADVEFTAAGEANVQLAAGKLKMNVSGVGGSTSLDAYMRRADVIH